MRKNNNFTEQKKNQLILAFYWQWVYICIEKFHRTRSIPFNNRAFQSHMLNIEIWPWNRNEIINFQWVFITICPEHKSIANKMHKSVHFSLHKFFIPNEMDQKAKMLTNICIAFSGSIKFGDLWNLEAFYELWPNLWSKSIAENHSYTVLRVSGILWRCQNITAHLTNILSNLIERWIDFKDKNIICILFFKKNSFKKRFQAQNPLENRIYSLIRRKWIAN